MRLKTRIFAFMSIVFVAFSAVIWLYSQTILNEINKEWTKRFVKKQVLFDKSRALFPILKELNLVKELAHNPHVINMALHIRNKKARKEGLETIEKYKLKFQNRSYFIAFSKTKEYFFNNSNDDYSGKEMRYILSQDNPKDSWFFYTLSKNDPFQINVNKDKELGVTKVWIDYVIKVNNQKLAVLGTGFDFDKFLENSVGIDQEGVKNFFFNKDLAIQLARETKLIDYSSMTHNGKHKNIVKFFQNEQDIILLKSLMEELYKNPEGIRSFWATFQGQKKLLGLTYLKKIGWFSLTVINSKELSLINKSSVVPILSLIFLIGLFSVGFALNNLILAPIEELKKMMKQIEDGDYTLRPQKVGKAEIAQLSEQFITMVKYIQKNNAALEQTIKERTINLQKSEQKLNTLLDSLEAYVFIKDTNLNYLYVNKKISEYFKKTKQEIIGKNDFAFFEKETAEEMQKNDKKTLRYKRKVTQEELGCDLTNKDVKVFLTTKIPLFDENEKVYALCGIATDITERKRTEELIKKLAFYDSLTGLPNRRMLKDRFDIILDRVKRDPFYGAFMVIDLDHFKTINDKYGHQAGDDLLIEVARRLKNTIRSVDTVVRYGGDEFIVLISDIAKEKHLAKDFVLDIANKILKNLNIPYELETSNQTVTFTCSASIGVSIFNKDDNPEDIFQEADQAMYKIKNSTRNGIYI
jgi:diguanylate cyclase (GGDEF)-like protein/PAS domain S-box-containing protein